MEKEYYVSLRIVLASSINEAVEKVENQEFEESHVLCDQVIPLRWITDADENGCLTDNKNDSEETEINS